MRILPRYLAGAALIALSLGPALGQTLPDTSRGEALSSGINSSLGAQERNRAASQQNQFEINSLRNQAPQPQMPPPPAVAGPRR